MATAIQALSVEVGDVTLHVRMPLGMTAACVPGMKALIEAGCTVDIADVDVKVVDQDASARG